MGGLHFGYTRLAGTKTLGDLHLGQPEVLAPTSKTIGKG
jgi:hypothetical protein